MKTEIGMTETEMNIIVDMVNDLNARTYLKTENFRLIITDAEITVFKGSTGKCINRERVI